MAASRNPLVRLGHIRDEIADLTKAFENASFENFSRSYVLKRTAEHGILIISEAVKKSDCLPASAIAFLIGARGNLAVMRGLDPRILSQTYAWGHRTSPRMTTD